MLRERSVRKAKDRANEHLHEISTNKALNTPNGKNDVATPKRAAAKPRQKQNESVDTDDEQLQQNRTRVRASGKKPTKRPIQFLHQQAIEQNTTDDDDNQLYTQLYTSTNASIQTIVDNWIESYKKNRESALIHLINFIIRSTGCRGGKLTPDSINLFKSKEYQSIINDLIEYMDDGEYPLQQQTQQTKKFKQNLIDFIQMLIQTCQYSIIYDQFLCDNLITFLISLSDSQIRAFRHTATLALMKLMTNFLDVQTQLKQNKDANRKQLDTEKQKTTQRRASDRLDMLTDKSKEYDEYEDELQNFINFIFKACFMHRYRDICVDIRGICIQELGEWMRKSPSKFLDDTYLKYIGWTLYDKSSDCRLKCIQALQPLYETEENSSRLELFTTRFKTRLLEMSLDKDVEVSCQTIRLLTQIIKSNMELIDDKDCESLYELVFHINRSIAQAAGEFLYEKLFDKIQSIQYDSSNRSVLQLLIQFLIECELHEHPAYLIDSLWPVSLQHNNMLKDWKAMCELLLNDTFCSDNSDNVDLCEQHLIQMIFCCVKQACTGEIPVARVTSAYHLTQKELKQMQDDKQEMTQYFIPIIGKLIEKYIADAEKLQYLLQIPLYFDLTQYTLRRQEKSLENFLQILNDILLNKHTDTQVLEICSRVYAYYCGEQDSDGILFNSSTTTSSRTGANSITIKCTMKRGMLIDTLFQQLSKIFKQFKEQVEVDLDELYPLVISLKRFSIFSQYHNIVKYTSELWSISNNLLKSAIDNESIDYDLVKNCFNLVRSLLCWNLFQLKNQTINTDQTSMQDTFALLKKISTKYYRSLNLLFIHANKQIELEAYLEISDLLILFNKNLSNDFFDYDLGVMDGGDDDESGLKRLDELVIECQANEINMLLLYCNNNVFNADFVHEKCDRIEKIEQLHRRRAILSAFCKLIVYNCVPIRYMADICRGHVKFSSSYGDIIKHTISQSRDISKLNTIKAISLTLQREFNELIMNQTIRLSEQSSQPVQLNEENIVSATPEFHQVKELAKKFLFLFNANDQATHDAIVEFHRDAIDYIDGAIHKDRKFQTLAFLDLISDLYLTKLNTNDKRKLLQYLNEKPMVSLANKNYEIWKSLFNYRDSLIHVNENAQAQVAAQQQQLAPQERDGDQDDEEDEEDGQQQQQQPQQQQESEQANVNQQPSYLSSTVLQSTRIDSKANRKKNNNNTTTSLFSNNVSNIITRKRKQDQTALNLSGITLLPADNVPKTVDGSHSRIEIIKKTNGNLLSDNFNKVTLNEKKRSRSPVDDEMDENDDVDRTLVDNNNSLNDDDDVENDAVHSHEPKRSRLSTSQTPRRQLRASEPIN